MSSCLPAPAAWPAARPTAPRPYSAGLGIETICGPLLCAHLTPAGGSLASSHTGPGRWAPCRGPRRLALSTALSRLPSVAFAASSEPRPPSPVLPPALAPLPAPSWDTQVHLYETSPVFPFCLKRSLSPVKSYHQLKASFLSSLPPAASRCPLCARSWSRWPRAGPHGPRLPGGRLAPEGGAHLLKLPQCPALGHAQLAPTPWWRKEGRPCTQQGPAHLSSG